MLIPDFPPQPSRKRNNRLAMPQLPAPRQVMAGILLATASLVLTLESAAEDETPPQDAPTKADPTAPQAAPGGHPFPRRVTAPPLGDGSDGDETKWINTSGPIELRDLRGKFVVLDFWTYCCINCLHILPELKKLEQAYPNNVVVIGVHSAKFDTEKDSQNIREAVLRHDIEHPVINDSEHEIWQRYALRGWPGLRIIDPQGDVVAGDSGEIDFETLDQFFKEVLPYYREKGLLDETAVRFDLEREKMERRPLRFPGKVLADEASQKLYIADSGHNRIVIADFDGQLLDVIGNGQRGQADGDFETANFALPQGMTIHNGQLYVADTENHLIRKVDLDERNVSTIAGTGKQNRGLAPGMDRIDPDAGLLAGLPERWVSDPAKFPLASPWSVLVQGDHLYIAMAGRHQIWRMTLDEKEIEVYAGSAIENISDGKLVPSMPIGLFQAMGRRFDTSTHSAFAQPSGLASDGEWLYVADSEGSAIRAVPFDQSKQVKTVVGATDRKIGPDGRRIRPLFSFGDRDGQGEDVLLQHVLGVAHHQGKLYISDTYNNKIKVIDLEKQSSESFVGDQEPGSTDEPARFDEPEGISYAAGQLFVADTNNHLIRKIDLATRRVSTLSIAGLKPPVREEKATGLAPAKEAIEVGKVTARPVDGSLHLNVKLSLPEGWKINPLAPTSYQVDVAGDEGPLERSEPVGSVVRLAKEQRKAEFSIPLPLTSQQGTDELSVTVRYYYCQEKQGGLCKVGDATWKLAVTLAADGQEAVQLSQ